MPRVVMLIGVPGTGKSTWTRNFLKKNDAEQWVVVSSDDILDELANIDSLTYAQSFEKYSGYAQKEMFRRAENAIANGVNVIWDQTNMNSKNRRKKLDMFPDSYSKEAVVFVVSDGELKRRLMKREAEIGKVIPPHVIKNMAASYEAPSKAEGFSKITYERN